MLEIDMTPPLATYRLQFRNGMTFDRAVDIVPYLKRLGVSHLYASPPREDRHMAMTCATTSSSIRLSAGRPASIG
jgi:hypothetical protein